MTQSGSSNPQAASSSSSGVASAPVFQPRDTTQDLKDFCFVTRCYNHGVNTCFTCQQTFCDGHTVHERKRCVKCYLEAVKEGKVPPVLRAAADTGSARSSTQDAPNAEAEVKPEIRETVDTDDEAQTTPGVPNPLRAATQQNDDDAAEMTRMEAEYDAYVSGRGERMPVLQQVRTIGARMRRFAARSNRTASVPVRRT